MPRTAYAVAAPMVSGHHRPWTDAETRLVRERIAVWPIGAVALAVERSPQAIRAHCWRLGIRCDAGGWLRSGAAARLTGYSQQHLTTLARRGLIAARRVPGGRTWLFAADSLPCAVAGRRRWVC